MVYTGLHPVAPRWSWQAGDHAWARWADGLFDSESADAKRATALAMRWRLQARHSGAGRYGQATGRQVEVMGISHAEIEAGLVVREWHLIDDVAVWMQLLDPRA